MIWIQFLWITSQQFNFQLTRLNASFYTEFEVPITLVLAQDLSVDSLRKYIDPRSGVLVDLIIIAGEAKMIVFCSQIGVLFIENPAQSGILQQFLKANQFYSKGQQSIQCIQKLCKSIKVININKHILEPKHISTDDIQERLDQQYFSANHFIKTRPLLLLFQPLKMQKNSLEKPSLA